MPSMLKGNPFALSLSLSLPLFLSFSSYLSFSLSHSFSLSSSLSFFVSLSFHQKINFFTSYFVPMDVFVLVCLESGIRIFLLQIDGFGCGFLTKKKYGFADSGCGCGFGLPTLAQTFCITPPLLHSSLFLSEYLLLY